MKNLTKRERIEFLLDHWQDFFETLHEVAPHVGEDTDAVAMMPAMSRHPSVKELSRAIHLTRQHMPTKCAHMMGFYTSEWRNTSRFQRVKRKKGRIDTSESRVRERVVPRWVRRQKVEDAVTHVVDSFCGEVFIPNELLDDKALAA